MSTEELFADHITALTREYITALQAAGVAGQSVLIHSGCAHDYYADDHAVPFRAWGHYLRWVPVDRPDQFVLLRPGHKPLFFAVIPQDFWHDPNLDMPAWWADQFDIIIIGDRSRLARELDTLGTERSQLSFLGEDTAFAAALGIAPAAINPAPLLSHLDYQRAFKTAYEVQRISEANAHALTGHQAAQEAFLAGGAEYDIHMAYLQACRVLDNELPYPNIVALNQHAATLHYQHKARSNPTPSQILLIDAGCRSHGYCSDITRTWARPGTNAVFVELLAGMQKLQRAVIASISPDLPYADLHLSAHRMLAQLLADTSICRGTVDELIEEQITATFMPHGLGHFLGLQVHDVGGRMAGPDGSVQPPPAQFPALRTTRVIENHMVFTIEPGVYFIPMLLDPLRTGPRSALLNWKLIDTLLPLGGIRIEDNIWMHDNQAHNLTLRPLK